MADLAALRTRLEGALDTLESVTAEFETAAASLAHGRLEGVARALSLRDAPETQRARDAVDRLAGDAPELEQALDRYRRARALLAERLRERTEALGVGASSDLEAVATLEREPLLYEGRAAPWAAMVFICLIGTVMTVLGWNQRGVGLVWLVVPALVLSMFFAAPKLRVTAKRVCVGASVVMLDEVEAFLIKRVERPSGKGRRSVEYDLVFERRDGEPSSFRVQVVPGGFTAALSSVGLHAMRL